MDKRKLYQQIAAIVTTLNEVGTDAAESTFYLALGMDLQLWNSIRDIMVDSDVITVSRSHRVALTDKGRKLATECAALIGR